MQTLQKWLGLMLGAVLASLVPQANRGTLSGTVVSVGPASLPISRAFVTVSGSALAQNRTTITDEQGGFVFNELPEGTFTLEAIRSPYLMTAYGARRPGGLGVPIRLSSGQSLDGLTLELTPGAVISGIVRGADGIGWPGISVEAVPQAGKRGTTARAVTDDRGVYRIFGLPPGEFLVAANITESPVAAITQSTDAEIDAILDRLRRQLSGESAALLRPTTVSGGAPTLPPKSATYGYSPIYFPQTPNPDEAVSLQLGPGDERNGIDIRLQYWPTVEVTGTVTSLATSCAQCQVILTRVTNRSQPGNVPWAQPATQRTNALGEFKLTGVLPGRYRLLAKGSDEAKGDHWALTTLSVEGSDVKGLQLPLMPGARITGRLVFDSVPVGDTDDRLVLRNASDDGIAVLSSSRAAVGTFEFVAVPPGTYRFGTVTSSGHWLRSVIVNGRDTQDFPLEVTPGQDIRDVVATFARGGVLSGTLATATGTMTSDYFVLLFPKDSALRQFGSRRVLYTRPNTNGEYSFRDFPAGDYLVVALTDLQPLDLAAVSLFDRLIPYSVPLSIQEGATTTQNLRLAKR